MAKILVNFPDDKVDYIKSLEDGVTDYQTTLKLYEVVRNGMVFPDNTTDIIESLFNKLKRKMKDRDDDNGGEPLNAVDRGYHLACEHLCEEIDNLLKENENGSNNN